MLRIATLLAAAVIATPAVAGDIPTSVDPATLAEGRRTAPGLYLTSADAARALAADPGIVFIDVRTRAEFNFVGHPDPVDMNIPFRLLDPAYPTGPETTGYAMVPNPDFGAAVLALLAREGVGSDATIFVICRSGHRSAAAADALADIGLTRVYNVIDGFEGGRDPATGHRTVEGWRHDRLPWSYGFRPEQAYRPAG